MFVLVKQRLVFLHIHKNAGSSVRSFLKRLGEDWQHKRWNERIIPGHVNYRDLVAAVPALRDHRFFVVSRNPWSRLVSAYTWWKSKPETRGGITRNHVSFLASFQAFVDHLERTADRAAEDAETRARLETFERHSRGCLEPGFVVYPTQWSYIVDAAGRPCADHVPFEALTTALPQYLSARLGREVAWANHHRNKGAYGDWRRYYTDRDVDRVARLFADDVRYFGYAFA